MLTAKVTNFVLKSVATYIYNDTLSNSSKIFYRNSCILYLQVVI